MSPGEIALSVVAGAGVGAFAAAFGVGGGLLMVPYMVFALGIGQHTAEATSLLVIIPTAAVGAAAHMRRGLVDLRMGMVVGLAGVAGAVLGAQIALGLSGRLLRVLFGVLVVIGGLRLIRAGLHQKKRDVVGGNGLA